MQTFAETLNELLEQTGMSQDDLAKKSGISQNTISKYTRGEVKDPGIERVIKLSRALSVPVSRLYPGVSEEMPKQNAEAPKENSNSKNLIVDYLISENENLWGEKKKDSEKELIMLKMLQHFVLPKSETA